MARLLWVLVGGGWLVCLVAGGLWTVQYQRTPGQAAEPEADWPRASPFRRNSGRFTLVLFAHPHCPCTRATFDELNWLLERAGDRVEPLVNFVVPPGAPADWERTTTARDAESALPGKVHIDRAGVEARRFQVKTSGQVLLFNPGGRLVFSGGITDGRGHCGDNRGRRAILQLLTGGEAGLIRHPVYGCPLLDDDFASQKGQS